MPKYLLERIQWWEFIDLAELVPPQSVHDHMIDTQARFTLFELIRLKRKQTTYTVYVAVLLQRFPEQRSEVLAYLLTIIRWPSSMTGCSGELMIPTFGSPPQGLEIENGQRWTSTCTPRFFTGPAKAVACCHVCDSTQHLAANFPGFNSTTSC